MSTETSYVLKSDQRKKSRLVRMMGGKCCICGYNKCLSALQFHHKDPLQKDFTISQNAHISFEKAAEEVKKCILVCANCHREIHAGLIENIDNYNCYLPEVEKEIIEELDQIKHKKIVYCKDCGKIISSDAIRCPECAKKASRKVERPDREELKNMIRTMPFTAIAAKYDVTDNSIRKWCKAVNLPTTKGVINSISDQKWKQI